MRRALAMSLVLLALPAAAQGTFTRWRRSLLTAKHVRAPLTGDNCTGATQRLTDGTAITWTRATAATCTKNDGSLVSLSSGQPRCNSSGCLSEGAATNVVQRSETFDNAYWTKTRSTITADQIAAPDGNTTADLLTLTATTGAHAVNAAGWSATCASGTGTWTASLYAKAGTVTFIRLSRVGNWQYAIFDLSSTGSLVAVNADNSSGGTQPSRTPATGHITSIVNGWFRIDAQFKCELSNQDGYEIEIATASATLNVSNPSFTAAGTETMYLWGAQGVVGSNLFVTSYIPTTSASVTRNADIASFTKPTWLADTHGCASAILTLPASVSFSSNPYVLGSSTSSNAYIFFTSAMTAVGIYDGTTLVTRSVSSLAGRSTTILNSWSGSSMTASADSTSTSGSFDGTLVGTTIYVGNNNGSSGQPYGYVSTIKLGATTGSCR